MCQSWHCFIVHLVISLNRQSVLSTQNVTLMKHAAELQPVLNDGLQNNRNGNYKSFTSMLIESHVRNASEININERNHENYPVAFPYKKMNITEDIAELEILIKQLKTNISKTKSLIQYLQKSVSRLVTLGLLEYKARKNAQLRNEEIKLKLLSENASKMFPDLVRESLFQEETLDDVNKKIDFIRNVFMRKVIYEKSKKETESSGRPISEKKIEEKKLRSHSFDSHGLSIDRKVGLMGLIENYLQSNQNRNSTDTKKNTGISADTISTTNKPDRSALLTDELADGINFRNKNDKSIDETKVDKNKHDYGETGDDVDETNEISMEYNRTDYDETKKDKTNLKNEKTGDNEDAVNTDRSQSDIKYNDKYYKLKKSFERSNVMGHTGEGFTNELNGDHRYAIQVQNLPKEKRLTRIKRHIEAYAYHQSIAEPEDTPLIVPHDDVRHDTMNKLHVLGVEHLVRKYFNSPRGRALDIEFRDLDSISRGNDPTKTLAKLAVIKKKLTSGASNFIHDFYPDDDESDESKEKKEEIEQLLSTTNDLFDQVRFETNHAVFDERKDELKSKSENALKLENTMNSRLFSDLHMLKFRLNDLEAAAKIRKKLKPHRKKLQREINRYVKNHRAKATKNKNKILKSFLTDAKKDRKSKLKFLKKQIEILTKRLGKVKNGKDIEGRRLQILLIQHQLEDLLNEGEGMVDPPTGFLDIAYNVPYFPRKGDYTARYRYPNPLYVPKNYYVEKFRYLRNRDFFKK